MKTIPPTFVFLLALLGLFLFTASSALAQTIPTKITSDRMTYDVNKNAVVFEDNVHVDREGVQLWAERITLHLKKKPVAPKSKAAPAATEDPTESVASPDPMAAVQGGDIDRIVAEKNVRLKYKTQTGQSQKATYFADQAMLLMEGDPILRDGDNTLRGHNIRYYLNENRSEVIGGPSRRVEAIFTTSDTKKKP